MSMLEKACQQLATEHLKQAIVSVYKSVNFKGVPLTVPSWAEFLTVDEVGNLEVWVGEPELTVDQYWIYSGEGCDDYDITTFEKVGHIQGVTNMKPECFKL